MISFEVWWRGRGDTRDDAKVVEAFDAGSAVEKLCERHFSDWDYPSFIDDMCVAEANSETVRAFDVEIEAIPHFAAQEKR